MFYLNKEPRGDEGQAAVLSVEPVVVRVEREVIQVEESVNKQIMHFNLQMSDRSK